MKTLLRCAVTCAILTLAGQASAQVSFFESADFQGRSFNTGQTVKNLGNYGFNDRSSSVIVLQNRWEVCEHADFHGQCVILRPGRYPSLAAMGINDRVSSVRMVNGDVWVDSARYAPPSDPVYDNRRRGRERLFEADITSVRAVVGPPEKRCWIEREQVSAPPQSNSNVPGAVVGALLGGILGHQVGSGRGNDLATVGGAIAGGAIGSQVGRDGYSQPVATQSVQRCREVPSQAQPELYDVSYSFRGVEHRLQMTTPPGPTITVNRRGEPRT